MDVVKNKVKQRPKSFRGYSNVLILSQNRYLLSEGGSGEILEYSSQTEKYSLYPAVGANLLLPATDRREH